MMVAKANKPGKIGQAKEKDSFLNEAQSQHLGRVLTQSLIFEF